jgi:hypothetical protein
MLMAARRAISLKIALRGWAGRQGLPPIRKVSRLHGFGGAAELLARFADDSYLAMCAP